MKTDTSICNLEPGLPLPRLLLRLGARKRADGVSRRRTNSHAKHLPMGLGTDNSFKAIWVYESLIFGCGGVLSPKSRFIFTTVVAELRETFCFAPRCHVFLSVHPNTDTRKQSIHKDDRPTNAKKPSRKSRGGKTVLWFYEFTSL